MILNCLSIAIFMPILVLFSNDLFSLTIILLIFVFFTSFTYTAAFFRLKI